MVSIGALGLFALGGFSGCNQSVDPVTPEESPTSLHPDDPTPAFDGTATDLGEGHPLTGDALEAFLQSAGLGPEAATPAADLPPAAPKSAASSMCLIDFNSKQGLNYMADKAYTAYATSPYYTQPCGTQYAAIRPTTGNYYYLPPENSSVCIGSYAKLGYGTITNCQNQQDASNFPRYASNGSPTDGALGLKLTVPDGANKRNFELRYFFARGGTITVYAYRIGIGWWYWGPISVAPGFFTFTNAQNVNEVQFFASDRSSIFSIDNILIRTF